jgi:excinuclease ABC subunit A
MFTFAGLNNYLVLVFVSGTELNIMGIKSLKKTGIEIAGARTHNLKNVSVLIPHRQLVVVTGVSGSGKSSLTIDTLYAEGQRRYVESLSSYARQFLSRMKKPEVDYIRGICPAIAIEQRVAGTSNRSTVGSVTELFDYLRMLYARIGVTISPVSGNEVKQHSVTNVVDDVLALGRGARVLITMPLGTGHTERLLHDELHLLVKKGFTRVYRNSELVDIEDLLGSDECQGLSVADARSKGWQVLIDRFVVDASDADNMKRLSDSVNTAFAESGGDCIVVDYNTAAQKAFSNRFELDGMSFLKPTPQLFNYNTSYGACPACEGFGQVIGIAEEKVIDAGLSIYEGAIVPWRESFKEEWWSSLVTHAVKVDLPVHTPYRELTAAQKSMVWQGTVYFKGVNQFFDDIQSALYKIQNRIILARYRGRTACRQCQGSRIRPEALNVWVGGRHIGELLQMPLSDLNSFFEQLHLTSYQSDIAKRLLSEIRLRLGYMVQMRLGYLTLHRKAATLSGGETQRLHLTRILGSNLTSSLYVLDEPSVGLHPRDTMHLVEVLRRLRDLGNTVLVVEHEEDIIKHADYLIDMGPQAGRFGGEVVYAGPYTDIAAAAPNSLTVGYMTGRLTIPVPKHRKPMRNRISIVGARLHNLKNVDVDIPLQAMTVVTGVSGSGKTTLIKQILYPFLSRELGQGVVGEVHEFETYTSIKFDKKIISGVEMIGQQAIGRSSRSNPATYVGVYDDIRNLMAALPASKIHGYKPGAFSLNVEGGRCEDCQGEGEQVIEMQFMADVRLECETCKGARFKSDLLEVRHKGKNIAEILDLSVDDAIEFFNDKPQIKNGLQPLSDVGLGYIRIGQSSSTLSGGESQRVKLAYYLGREGLKLKQFFIFDEPTTGLHLHDIARLTKAFQALVERGHTVLIVEHHMDVIKSADWLIDLGPEGGDLGGHVIYQGPPEGLIDVEASHTGYYLRQKLGVGV